MTIFVNTGVEDDVVWSNAKYVPEVGDKVLVMTQSGMKELTVKHRVWFMQDTMTVYQKEQCVTLVVE